MLRVVIQSVGCIFFILMLNTITLSVIMLYIIMLSVIMLNVIMLSVMAPLTVVERKKLSSTEPKYLPRVKRSKIQLH
jgi:hypothetical protein